MTDEIFDILEIISKNAEGLLDLLKQRLHPFQSTSDGLAEDLWILVGCAATHETVPHSRNSEVWTVVSHMERCLGVRDDWASSVGPEHVRVLARV